MQKRCVKDFPNDHAGFNIVSLPPKLKKRMEQFTEINWSEVARKAIDKKVRDLEFLEDFTSDSAMDEEMALELGRRVNKALAARYQKEE